MSEEQKLLPEIPILSEYNLVKEELLNKIEKLNSIKTLTEDNKKEVKNGIAEINKVKDRISRYRIDETNKYLSYIQPYIDKCKELEELCTKGISEIKGKVKELEEKEKAEKKETILKLFNFVLEQTYPQLSKLLKFEMFFNEKMCNKTTSISVIEKELNEWLEKVNSDIKFIKENVDDVEAVITIYLQNGLKLTQAIETNQKRFVEESEIKAMMAQEDNINKNSFEKKLDITIKIKQLPKSKVKALQNFLDNLGVDFEVSLA